MEKSIFLRLFGVSPKLRVMDFLIVHSDFDYSMTEIAEKSGVGYSTLKLFWNDLVKNKIVVKTRDIGRAKLYKLNKDNPVVAYFCDMYWKITKEYTKKEYGKVVV